MTTTEKINHPVSLFLEKIEYFPLFIENPSKWNLLLEFVFFLSSSGLSEQVATILRSYWHSLEKWVPTLVMLI